MVIAKAVVLAGQVYAHDDLGNLRMLCVGDELTEGETVITPLGGGAELELIDGSSMRLCELSGTRIVSELIESESSETPHCVGDVPVPVADPFPLRFGNLVDGRPVQTLDGHNLFYDEMPLYWSLACDGRIARAVVPAGCADVVIDRLAFTLELDSLDHCSLELSGGSFLIESHNIPFTTGDPQPGLPVAFYGICEEPGSQAHATRADSTDQFSASLGDLGCSNNWYKEGRDIVFEFLGKPTDASPGHSVSASDAYGSRAINNFSLRNTGTAAACLIIKAYRGCNPAPLFEDGSESAPVQIKPGGAYMVAAEFNYDRLVLTRPEGIDNVDPSFSLEGYSEFLATDALMAIQVSSSDTDVKRDVELRFVLSREKAAAGRKQVLSISQASTQVGPAFNSVWEWLGQSQ